MALTKPIPTPVCGPWTSAAADSGLNTRQRASALVPRRTSRSVLKGLTSAATLVGTGQREPRFIRHHAIRERRRATRIDRSAKFLEGSEMTSGNIQLGPGPDRILDALKELLRDDPEARQRPTEEVSKELVRGGYLQEEPDPVLVAEMLEGLEGEEQSLQADEGSEEGNPT